MNILFVDDNEISISSAKDYLEEKGYNCEYSEFNNFDTNQYEYDIIVIDMMHHPNCRDASRLNVRYGWQQVQPQLLTPCRFHLVSG